jgi:hypothetical protein
MGGSSKRMIHAETQSSSPGPGIAAVSVENWRAWHADRFFHFFAAMRLCMRFFFRPKGRKPPLFSDGYGLGAIQELRKMYTATVTVVK